jgi:hypothetical protein
MASLTEDQRSAYREQIIDKLTALLKADSASEVGVSSNADDAGGVSITLKVPKGVVQLGPHIRDLAAVISERAV